MRTQGGANSLALVMSHLRRSVAPRINQSPKSRRTCGALVGVSFPARKAHTKGPPDRESVQSRIVTVADGSIGDDAIFLAGCCFGNAVLGNRNTRHWLHHDAKDMSDSSARRLARITRKKRVMLHQLQHLRPTPTQHQWSPWGPQCAQHATAVPEQHHRGRRHPARQSPNSRCFSAGTWNPGVMVPDEMRIV
jgi:hypothetical protein